MNGVTILIAAITKIFNPVNIVNEKIHHSVQIYIENIEIDKQNLFRNLRMPLVLQAYNE